MCLVYQDKNQIDLKRYAIRYDTLYDIRVLAEMKKRNANLYVICLLIAFTIVVYRWNNKVIPEKAMEVEEPQRELFKIRTILLDLPDGEKEYYKYLPNLRTGRKNDALIAHGECVALKKKKKEKSNQTRMILLTDFIPYVEKVHRDKSLIANKRSPTDEEIDARLFELVETLQGNVSGLRLTASN